MLVLSALKVDSLENELRQRDQFFNSIQAIVSGEVPEDNLFVDTTVQSNQVEFTEFNHDSVFQDKLLAEQTAFLWGQITAGSLALVRFIFLCL